MLESADVLIVGSGAAAVSCARPILEAGRSITMLEAGNAISASPPSGNLLGLIEGGGTFKYGFDEQPQELFHESDSSPKLNTSIGQQVTGSGNLYDEIALDNYKLYRSAKTGGLGEIWGAYTTSFSKKEIERLGFPAASMRTAYNEIADEIGVSGINDDLGGFHGDSFPLELPPKLSPHLDYLINRYKEGSRVLDMSLGAARNAVITSRKDSRSGCNSCGLCLYGCSRNSIYRPSHTLNMLKNYSNFTLKENTEVSNIASGPNNEVIAIAKDKTIYRAKELLVAAGTVNSTLLAANLLDLGSFNIKLLNNPAAAFAFIIPKFLGRGVNATEFALAQLAYVMSTEESFEESVTGSLYSASTVPMQYLAREMPFSHKASLRIARYLSSGLVLSNLFLPGSFSKNILSSQSCRESRVMLKGHWTREAIGEVLFQKRRLIKNMRNLGAYYIPRSLIFSTPGTDAHAAGTITINGNNALSCSPDCELKGKRHIYFIDGSVINSLPAKHLTFTIMANARRVGRIIAAL